MESILTSIKMLLGMPEDYIAYDDQVTIHINSVFMILTQLGVGPEEGFAIKDKEAVWNDYISDETKSELIKSYVYLKVKLLFDPPSNSSVIESINRQIDEFEWRLNVKAESNETS